MTESGRTPAQPPDRPRHHRFDRRLQGRRAAAHAPERRRRRPGADDDLRGRVHRHAHARDAEPPPGRLGRAGARRATGGSATSRPPTTSRRSSSPRPRPTGSARWPTALPATRSRPPAWPRSVPVVVAPAMDGGMYAHPATQANVARLREFGYSIVEPEIGRARVRHGRPGPAGDALGRIVDAAVSAAAQRPPNGARQGRPRSHAASAATQPAGAVQRPTWPAATSSSPPAARPSRSTRSGSSAIARPARWASPSPRTPSIAARP